MHLFSSCPMERRLIPALWIRSVGCTAIVTYSLTMPVFSVRRRESIPKEASWPSHAGTPCTSAKIYDDSNLSDENHSHHRRLRLAGKNFTRAVTERSINLDLLRQVSRSMRIRCLILPNARIPAA